LLFRPPQRRFFRIGETANGLLQLLYSKTAESSMGDGVRGTIALTCVQVITERKRERERDRERKSVYVREQSERVSE
jgi:hypothetical protein